MELRNNDNHFLYIEKKNKKTNRKRTSELFTLNKVQIFLIVGVITIHCPINVHAVRLKIWLQKLFGERRGKNTSKNFRKQSISSRSPIHRPYSGLCINDDVIFSIICVGP